MYSRSGANLVCPGIIHDTQMYSSACCCTSSIQENMRYCFLLVDPALSRKMCTQVIHLGTVSDDFK